MLIRLTVFCVWLPSIASVTVSTKNGDIEGFVTSYANFSFAYKHVNKFLGVPFAAPPTSQLRFNHQNRLLNGNLKFVQLNDTETFAGKARPMKFGSKSLSTISRTARTACFSTSTPQMSNRNYP